MLPVPVGNFAVLCHYLDAPPYASATSFSPRIRGFVQNSNFRLQSPARCSASKLPHSSSAGSLANSVLVWIGRNITKGEFEKLQPRYYSFGRYSNIRPLPSAVNTFYVDPAFAIFRKADRTAGPLFHFRPSSSDPGFCTELLPRCASRRWSAPRRDLQWFAPPSGCGRGRER